MHEILDAVSAISALVVFVIGCYYGVVKNEYAHATFLLVLATGSIVSTRSK